MSKESNTETIKLSPEEVANIKANRKKRELERVKQLEVKKAEREQNIINAKTRVEKNLYENKKYEEAVKSYFNKFEEKFPGEFKLVRLKDTVYEETCSEYIKNANNCDFVRDKNGNAKQDVYYKQKYKLKRFDIKSTKIEKCIIDVSEHFPVGNIRYYGYGSRKSNGYKMRVLGLGHGYIAERKFLTSVVTVRQKVEDAIEHSNQIADSLLQEKASMSFVSNYIKDNYSEHIKEISDDDVCMSVTFKNNLKVEFSYELLDNEYSIKISSIDIDDVIDKGKVLEELLKIK